MILTMPAEMKSIFLFFVCVQIFVGIVHSAAIVNDTDEKLCKLCNASCLMLQSGEKHDDVAFGDTWSYSCASSRPQDDAEFDVREIDQGTIVVAGEEDEVYYISKFIDSSKNGKHLHVHVLPAALLLSVATPPAGCRRRRPRGASCALRSRSGNSGP